MRRLLRTVSLLVLPLLLASCAAGLWGPPQQREASSVVDYLYPKDKPVVPEPVTYLNLPVKVGIAFVPENRTRGASLSEERKLTLLKQVKQVFEKYEYVKKIEIIPSAYLRPGGGFDNLDQIGRMFDVDVMALVSYDQIQFDNPNTLSFLYWTIVGAYVIKGDQHDTQTMVDAAVFDIHSRKLLFRAPGTSVIKGSATMVNYQKAAREGRVQGYEEAVGEMIPNLERELAAFKERIKQDQSVQVRRTAEYKGGGAFGWPMLIALALLGIARRVSHRSPAGR